MRPRYDVAIHAPNAAPLYAAQPGPTGGAEIQMRRLAAALADRGLRVAHIVFDHPELPAESGGVRLIRAPGPSTGSGVGTARYAGDVLEPLRAADAAVYIQRNAGFETGVVAASARMRGRRFVLSTSWDGDLTLEAPLNRAGRLSYRLGRRLADVVVVQTDDQLHRAREIVKNPVRLIRSFAEVVGDAETERDAYLWIGRVVDYKDPLAFVELAERVPEARFLMIPTGREAAEPALWEALLARAAGVSNLELLSPRPRDQLGELYDRAVAVVSTSLVEGFPNTFMEGWSRGTAALSLRLDPDGMIQHHDLGRVAEGSLDRLAELARELWSQRGELETIGRRARDYIRNTHSPERVGQQWAELVLELSMPWRDQGQPPSAGGER